MTIGSGGVFADEISGTCFGVEFEKGYFCHYAYAGQSDFELDVHGVSFWTNPSYTETEEPESERL